MLALLFEYCLCACDHADNTSCSYICRPSTHYCCFLVQVIVTSWLFPSGKFSLDRLRRLSALVGRDRLVVDLSCRRVRPSAFSDVDAPPAAPQWVVAMDKWQTLTDTVLGADTLAEMEQYCSEFLVHAADVEGLCRGIDEELVEALGRWSTVPCTYAGGGKDIADLARVEALTSGKLGLTFGSALDIFGGKGVTFDDCVKWNTNALRKCLDN